MSENNARLERDLYDYEHEDPRSAGGRRRRPVADWGVGDDVFEHMPRNRFPRTAEGPPRERRFAPRSETAERRGAAEPEQAPEAEQPAAAEAPPPDVPRGRVDDGRRTIRIGRPEDVPSEIAAIAADRDIPDEPAVAARAADTEAPPAPGERRTIRIGGRPEGSLEATRAQRRRPPRTAQERVGARPDRLAAWAVALGILLILIAILSTAL